MTRYYKVTDAAAGQTWFWTAQELLEEVNRDRSDDWTAYTMQDLEQCPHDIAEWIEYTVDEVTA